MARLPFLAEVVTLPRGGPRAAKWEAAKDEGTLTRKKGTDLIKGSVSFGTLRPRTLLAGERNEAEDGVIA